MHKPGLIGSSCGRTLLWTRHGRHALSFLRETLSASALRATSVVVRRFFVQTRLEEVGVDAGAAMINQVAAQSGSNNQHHRGYPGKRPGADP